MRRGIRLAWLKTTICPSWMPGLYIKITGATEALLIDRGQDLVEYAVVAALISLAAIAGMKGVATALGVAFTKIGTKFASYTS
jgi:pilus assembly protein Flp/PilA